MTTPTAHTTDHGDPGKPAGPIDADELLHRYVPGDNDRCVHGFTFGAVCGNVEEHPIHVRTSGHGDVG